MVNGADIIEYAKQFIGVPYVFGGTSPSGFDCSGLVQYVYRHFGINISRTTKTQINEGREVDINNLQLGDLVFPSSGHVTLYVGNGHVIHAPQPGDRVKISKLWSFWRAKRILADENNNNNNEQDILNDLMQAIQETEEFLNNIHNEPQIPIGNFIFQTETCLHKTGKNFEFLVGDYNGNGLLDIYCIKKDGTGSGKTEVHVLDGANNYKNYLLQTETALHETDGNWQFCLGDYNGDGYLDLYCICKRNTGSNSTEVHILSGADNFHSFLLQTGTKLHETDDNWKFCLGDFNGDGKLDLYCIKKSDTGSGRTEVHILGGNCNYNGFIFQAETALHETGDNWDFCVSGKNLYCIAKSDTGSNTTEVHILNGDDNFKSFILQTETELHETGDDFDFYVYGSNLFAFSKQGQSNTTEVHTIKI